MAVKSQLTDGSIFQAFAGFSDHAPNIIELLYASERGGGNCPKTYAVLTECVK